MDIDEEDNSSESSSSDDEFVWDQSKAVELIELLESRIKYGQEWLEHRQDVETKILDDKEWKNLDQITISFQPPILEPPFIEMLWSWSESIVGNMRNNYDEENIAPSPVEIAELRRRMDKTNEMAKNWIANETRKLEIMKKKEGIGA